MQVIILAGGSGSRLWPISRKDFPKQFLKFGDDESLLQKTVKRFLYADFVENIFISTNETYAAFVEEQIDSIDLLAKCELLIEPESKNTTAAIALAIKHLEEKGIDTSEILVVPSDHYISPEKKLHFSIEIVRKWIKKKKIAVFGIRPHRPETGYGYIHMGKAVDKQHYQVECFVEKPHLEKAKDFVFSGEYLWNTGMFAFSSETFWEELKKYAPSIHKVFSQKLEAVLKDFSFLPSVSIDYTIMEKTKKLIVSLMDVSWSDIGSWDRVYDVLEKDQNQNVKIGNVIDIETKNSLIISGKKLISTIGLEDIVIIETEEAIFIAKRSESEKVKQLVEKIQKTTVL